ncbi:MULTISPECIES: isoprenylcysteine carboxylmethyltransferase family protein [unclassified Haladaptatus]|uniref:methyltransferase family protein n=1 Tax=unclassified Haladaptatus TaxID=2622732 RepID=UPI0023E872EB|nr:MULTISPECIES: methyltransferase [unclassified Haladaptatus]
MLTIVFSIGLAAAVSIIGLYASTLVIPGWRFWPPGEKSWKYFLHWGLIAVFNVTAIGVAVLDWNSGVLPRPASLVVGVPVALVGIWVYVRSEGEFDTDETTGLEGDLHTTGAYARSRNPQYVGMLVGLAGFILVVNSLFLTILLAIHICWLLLLPFVEEPWLEQQFGEPYRKYTNEVPRFVGKKTFERD